MKGCLARCGVTADTHLTLSEYGLKKRYGADCTEEDADMLFEELSFLLKQPA
ncbi:hypothetical protein D3C84_1215310 [compost metagenome]